jgi:demethylmenaquinone methyltransferase/2-methoxy-6-polyprenyl-1,4-benzoquinol methylase
MAYLNGSEREKFVNQTFTDIAPRYVFMNHLMTGGMDVLLRKEAVRAANLRPGERVLDLGTGTGDLAREARNRHGSLQLTAADFTLAMMTATKDWHRIDRSAADALRLPFADHSFDVVMSGYLVRNVTNLAGSLAEQFRVLKPGGRVIILDTTRPRKNFFTPFINFYFKKIIPLLGALLNRNRVAYTYLTQSTEGFVTAETLTEVMRQAGFDDIHFRVRMFGTMAIHTAHK